MGELVPINKNGFLWFSEEASLEEIRKSLAPADGRDIGHAIATIFSALKSSDRGEVDSAMTARVYEMALEEFPAYAIHAAVKAFVMGKVEGASKTFVPSTAELVNEIEKQMWLVVRKQSPKAPEPVLPDDHFSKRWESIKDDALKGKVISDAVE